MDVKNENALSISENVIESYIFATGHQNLSIYSERLLMLLVRAAQCQIAGLNFKDGTSISQASIGKLGDALVEIEVKELLSSSSNTNYKQAKEAVLELMTKTVSHEKIAIRKGKPVLNENGEPVYEFEAHSLINDVWINNKPGYITVNINKSTWEAILNFSKGFRRYDLQLAMKLSRTYALRVYKLISNQTGPLQFTIAELRKQWGLEDKYPKTTDFIKNTIVSAKTELDKMSPWTFDFVPQYGKTAQENKGRVGRKSVTSIIFYPKKQLQFESGSNLIAMTSSPNSTLGKPAVDYLVKSFDFSISEIKANLPLFEAAKKYMDILSFLDKIKPKALHAKSPQGYVVNSIKKHLREEHGLVFRKNEIILPSSEKAESPEVQNARTLFDNDMISQMQEAPQPKKKKKDGQSLGDILGGLFADLEPDDQTPDEQ